MTDHSNELDQIFSALVKFRAELPKVSKDAKANYGKYATLDSLIDAVSPALAKHGLSFSQLITRIDDNVDGLTTMLLHSSGQWFSSTAAIVVESNGRIIGAQAQGSAITYARRYGLAAALGIAPDEDDDGAAASGGNNRQFNKQPSASKPQVKIGVVESAPDPATRAKLHAVLGDNYESVIAATVQKTGGNLTQAGAIAILKEYERRKEQSDAVTE